MIFENLYSGTIAKEGQTLYIDQYSILILEFLTWLHPKFPPKPVASS